MSRITAPTQIDPKFFDPHMQDGEGSPVVPVDETPLAQAMPAAEPRKLPEDIVPTEDHGHSN